MKVVLFCGGRGMRMRDGVEDVPKPLSVVGGLPLLWHVMSWYAGHGHRDFVLCLGYRADDVRRVVREHADASWHVEYVDTGVDTLIGQRLVKVRRYVQDEDVFLANYCDLLSDVPLPEVVDEFTATDAVAGLVAVRPQASFHLVQLGQGGRVSRVAPVTDEPIWQNGGFFVMRPEVFDSIRPGEELVDAPFARLAAAGRLYAFPWEGFWVPLDTQKDRQRLDALHAAGQHPWLVRHQRGAASSVPA